MPTKQIVCVGTSSGGIEALMTFARGLPADFAASVFVVLHSSPDSPGVLAEVLQRAGKLAAANAIDRERIEPGRIYVAPPDFHLIVEPGVVRLTRGPKENRFRPAIDPLFRSAASVYGPLAVGVILTGNLDDGVAGLWAIKQLGGTTIVQDPADALYPAMPQNAMKVVRIDYCLPVVEIPALLARLASEEVLEKEVGEVPEKMDIENRIANDENAIEVGVQKLGHPSSYACPECHGVLLQLDDDVLRFRCHTGHAYSVESLLAEISDKMEEALWAAVRSFEEGAMLMRQMAANITDDEHRHGAKALLKQAERTKRRADKIKEAVSGDGEPQEA